MLNLPEIPKIWIEMAKKYGGVLAGGCLRDLVLQKPVNDIDIFIPGWELTEEDNIKEYAEGFRVKGIIENEQLFQIIQHRFDNNVEEILAHFDVNICKIAYYNGWYITDDFIRDTENKTLTVVLHNWRHIDHLEKLRKKFQDYTVIDMTDSLGDFEEVLF